MDRNPTDLSADQFLSRGQPKKSSRLSIVTGNTTSTVVASPAVTILDNVRRQMGSMGVAPLSIATASIHMSPISSTTEITTPFFQNFADTRDDGLWCCANCGELDIASNFSAGCSQCLNHDFLPQLRLFTHLLESDVQSEQQMPTSSILKDEKDDDYRYSTQVNLTRLRYDDDEFEFFTGTAADTLNSED